mgnify:CR=1 FL=1
MKNFLSRLTAPVTAIGTMALPWIVRAQFELPGDTGVETIEDITGEDGILCRIAGLLFVILIVVTIIFIIVAAFKYLTAGGDPEKIKSANYQLVYAAIALVIALVARAFPNIIGTFIGSEDDLLLGCG